jgi:hypothetical protein
MKKLSDFYKVFQVFLGLIVLEGILANVFYFRSPSESQNAFLWGYSLQRLAIGALSIFLFVIFTATLILSFTSRELLKRWLQKLINSFNSPARRIIILLPLAIILALDLGINLVYAFPVLLRFVPFITVKRSLLQQTGMVQVWAFLIPLQIWAFLFSLKFMVFCLVFGNQEETGQHKVTLPGKLVLLSSTTAGTALVLSILWGQIFGNVALVVLQGPTGKLLILSVWFVVWFALNQKNADWTTRQTKFFISVSLWLVTFLIAAQVAQWMDSLNTPILNYWNFLADAFLHGRLFLVDPPAIGDMTFYNGHWYIPIPPLPAFLLMPFIAIWGTEAFNTTIFSLALSSTTSVFLFLILEELSRLKWIRLSRSGIIWLVVLFSFGTVQLWLGISSVVWYFSQICTILFVAAAFFLTAKRFPAWISGLALALALLGRPNVFVLWPALVLITLQLQLDLDGKFSWKRLLTWAAWSAIPVFLSAFFLLYYNFLRFGNFLDFGYVNINGSARVVRLVQEYGMFNIYFIPTNLQAMILALPELKAKCDYYFPSGNGLTMIATTPAFLYVLQRTKFSWWTLGCWISILLSAAMLLTYHNTGAVQISYRYVMDFVIPLIMVLAFTAGERISIPLKALIILSIIVNYYAIVSWYYGPC